MRYWKMKRMTIAAGAGFLTLFAAGYAVPASAQQNAALVRNTDEKGRNPYMQFQGVACPGGGAPCQVVFPPVPEGKRLVLEHVNASVNFAAGRVKRLALLTPAKWVFVLPTRPSSDPNLIVVNEPALVYYDSGQTPIFQVVGDGADAPLVTAVLFGYLVGIDPQR